MTSTKFETKPLFTRRQLTALLLPLIAEQALSVTIGLADVQFYHTSIIVR